MRRVWRVVQRAHHVVHACMQEHTVLALDLCDAAALLWRMQLYGMDVGSRWEELAGERQEGRQSRWSHAA